MAQALSQNWTRFLTEGIPLRQGSWLLNSQPCLLTIHNGVAQFSLLHNRTATLGTEHFRGSCLITPYTLMLTHGISFQMLVTQGGALPLNLVERLPAYHLEVPSGMIWASPETPWFCTGQAA